MGTVYRLLWTVLWPQESVKSMKTTKSSTALSHAGLVDSFTALAKTTEEFKLLSTGPTLAPSWKTEAMNRVRAWLPDDIPFPLRCEVGFTVCAVCCADNE